jgi:TatD DNase family protein
MHPPLVDYHCHLDLYPDYKSIFEQCCSEKVEVLTMTTTPRAWNNNKDLASSCSSIRIALGLHPQLVAEGYDEFALFESLLPNARYVGEVGLDAGPRYFRNFDVQVKMFERVLCSCAEHGNKIISIHAVRAARNVLTLVKKHLPQNKGKTVFHWFTGSKAEAKEAVALGCYFSINPEMLKSESRRELIASLPIERILTETDGPFTIINNRPSKPSDVVTVLTDLALLFNMNSTSLRSQININLHALEG